MNKVWIYTISFYTVDDEYGHQDFCGTFVEVLPSKESAERFKKDFEDEKNLKYLSDKYTAGLNLYGWFYNSGACRFDSSINEHEILNY